MDCTRFQTDGMRFLDGEMTADEKNAYEAHVADCATCAQELEGLGRIVKMTSEVRLKEPDDRFWDAYWKSIYRRVERGIGFIILIVSLVVLIGYAAFRAVTSPEFLTFQGLAVTAVLLGLLVVFISVVRERLHERRSDPYREVKR